VPPALARVIDRCLEKSPAARFQSTRDLTFALEALEAQSGTTTSGAIPAVTAHRDHHRDRRAWLRTAAASLATAAVAVAATLYVRPAAPQRAITRLAVVGPESSDGAAGFAISRDGRKLAFVAADNGVPRVWIRALDDTTARPVPGTDGALYPFW